MKPNMLFFVLFIINIHFINTMEEQSPKNEIGFFGHISSYLFPPSHQAIVLKKLSPHPQVDPENTQLHTFPVSPQEMNINIVINNDNSNIANSDAQSHASSMVKNWHEYAEHSSQFITYNKWKFIGASLLASYTYLCYQVICGNRYLQNNDLWSVWKNPLSLQELCALPQENLTLALIIAIQNQYIDPANPLNASTSLAQFMHEIEVEKKQLQYYQTLYKWIKKTHTSWLLPLNTAQYKSINKRLDRIAFIKHTCINWITDHKLEQNKGHNIG